MGKGDAFKAWRKLGGECRADVITEAIERQRSYLEREGGKYIPNLSTFLNQRRWEDDPPAVAQAGFLSPKTAGNLDAARTFVDLGRTP